METEHLKRAIVLARENMLAGQGGPFGAVVVRDGQPIGEGWNRVTTARDPTAHAEINAIRAACREINDFSLLGCDIFSSCEPCPMCLAAIMWARIGRVFFAASAADAAAAGFDDHAFYVELSKPSSERTPAMSQGLRAEGQSVFEDWLAKPDRIPY